MLIVRWPLPWFISGSSPRGIRTTSISKENVTGHTTEVADEASTAGKSGLWRRLLCLEGIEVDDLLATALPRLLKICRKPSLT